MAAAASLRIDLRAECAVKSLPKKPRSPHFCGSSRPYIYKACNMQTDVGISDSIIIFMIVICVKKGRSEN